MIIQTGPKTFEETQGHAPNYPIIGDPDLAVAKLYDMLPASETPGKRTAADNARPCARCFVIGPDKKVEGDAHLPDEHRPQTSMKCCACSIRCSLPPSIRSRRRSIGSRARMSSSPHRFPTRYAKKKYPQGYKTLKPYLRVVSQPKN